MSAFPASLCYKGTASPKEEGRKEKEAQEGLFFISNPRNSSSFACLLASQSVAVGDTGVFSISSRHKEQESAMLRVSDRDKFKSNWIKWATSQTEHQLKGL